MSTAERIDPSGPIRAFRSSLALADSERYSDDLVECPELNFGPLRVRVPPDAVVRMSSDEQHSDAVYFDFPIGTVRLSVFAAPRNHALWPSRAEEIAGSQAGAGARVSSVWGDWGRELHIVDEHQYNWVIGVDGARWMLLGRASWTVERGWELVDVMRSMIRTARVDRGTEPMPVRAPMPLTPPGTDEEEAAPDADAPYSVTVTMRMPDREAEPEHPLDPSDPAPRTGELAQVDSSERALPGADPRSGRTGRSHALSSGRIIAAAAAAIGVAAGSLWLTHEPPAASPTAPAAMPATPPAAMPATPPAALAPPNSLGADPVRPTARPPAASQKPAHLPARPRLNTPPVPVRGGTAAVPVDSRGLGRPGQGPSPSAGDRAERTRSQGADGVGRRGSETKRDEDRRSKGRQARSRDGGPSAPGPLDDVARLPGQLIQLALGL